MTLLDNKFERDLQQWANQLVIDLQSRIGRHKMIETTALQQSVKTKVALQGSPTIGLSFLPYGRIHDMTRKQRKVPTESAALRRFLLIGKPRTYRGKKWYNKTVYSSLSQLHELSLKYLASTAIELSEPLTHSQRR